jgi:hypothetical protein
MMRIDRRHASSPRADEAALAFAATRSENWYADPHRRAAYERWREAEISRLESAARLEHRPWSMVQWDEHEHREAWARQQPWYH